MLATTAARTTPSVLPNIELVRCVVRELYENKDDFMSYVDDLWENADNYSGDEFLTAASEAFDMFTPTLNSIIDVSMKNSDIFLAKNDFRSSCVGGFQADFDKPMEDILTPAEQHSGIPFVPLNNDRPGISYFPSKVKTVSTKLSARKDGEPRYITNYRLLYHGTDAIRVASKINSTVDCQSSEHKHPIRYALQFFASTVVNCILSIVPDHIIVVGTVTEAFSVIKWTGVVPYALIDDSFEQDKYPAHKALFEKTGIMKFESMFNDFRPIIFITGDSRCVDIFEAKNPFEGAIRYFPVCDYLKLLRDNANKALLYQSPKFNGMDEVRLRFWDKAHKVATYTLKATPNSKGDYDALPFSGSYRLHPLYANDQKKCLLENELVSLHFLKIAIRGKRTNVMVPTKELPNLLWDILGPDVRAIPAFSPIDVNLKYREHFGIPMLVHLAIRSEDLTLRIVNLESRYQCNYRKRDSSVSGIADYVLLAFKKDDSFELASMLYSSQPHVLEPGFPAALIDVLMVVGFFKTPLANRVLCGSGFRHDGYYVLLDPVYAITKPTSLKVSAFKHPYEENWNMLLPVSTTKVIAKVTHYVKASNETDFMHNILGIKSAVSIQID